MEFAAFAAGVDGGRKVAEQVRVEVAAGKRSIEDGRVDIADVDLAVERLLTLKFRLGLFERPFVEAPTATDLATLEADERALALDLARRSLVLAENDGTLPLAPSTRRIAVIGPNADSSRDLLGDYAHLLHIETLRELRHRANPFGFPDRDVINPIDELSGRQTILAALRERFGTERISYARGSGLRDGTDEELQEAVVVAREADVAIVILGERSGLTDDATSGEARDRRDLGLLGRQQELLESVVGTGTPTILVVVSGRPLAIEWAAEHCSAVLLAWVPGDAGPGAIAHVLAGDVDPGGRLPVTVPRDVGQVPLTYRHHPTGGKSNWKIDYVDGSSAPLWPFGHGRSYTSFTIDHLRVDKSLIQTSGDAVTIRVDVTNTGQRSGDEVVQLYVRDNEASVARPVLELRGFRRLHLAAGECRTVAFRLSTEQLAYYDVDMRRIVEPGGVRLFVGRSAADLPLVADVDLVGPVVELVDRRDYVTPSTIE